MFLSYRNIIDCITLVLKQGDTFDPVALLHHGGCQWVEVENLLHEASSALRPTRHEDEVVALDIAVHCCGG